MRLRSVPMDRRALEQAIARLPEVEHARVVVNGNTVTEVHVLASSGKPAKQLVRDVQSVALAGFDVEVDRRVISVVQFESPDLANRDRPLVEDVSEQIDGSRMRVTVTPPDRPPRARVCSWWRRRRWRRSNRPSTRRPLSG
jgi:hypothetical protein